MLKKILLVLAAALCLCTAPTFAMVSNVHEDVGDNIKIDYFTVKLKDKAVVDKINADIKTVVDNFKLEAAKYHSATLKFHFKYEGMDYLSLVSEERVYNEGAAHDSPYFRGLVYNVKTGDRVSLDSLYTPTVENLKYIFPKNLYHLGDGTPVDPEAVINDVAFVPTEFFMRRGSTICLIFQPYDVTPYSEGPVYLKLDSSFVYYLKNHGGQNPADIQQQ